MKSHKGVCPTDGRLCARECPVPSIDNLGQPYAGCARWRLKSLEELGLKKIEGAKVMAKPIRSRRCSGCGVRVHTNEAGQVRDDKGRHHSRGDACILVLRKRIRALTIELKSRPKAEEDHSAMFRN